MQTNEKAKQDFRIPFDSIFVSSDWFFLLILDDFIIALWFNVITLCCA